MSPIYVYEDRQQMAATCSVCSGGSTSTSGRCIPALLLAAYQVLPNSWTGQFVGTCTNGVLSGAPSMTRSSDMTATGSEQVKNE